MQTKFEIPQNIATQIEALNGAINTDGILIAPKWRSIGHNGRAIEIPVFSLSVTGSGRLNSTAQAAKDAVLPTINAQIAEAARQAIEQQIEAEKAERQSEAARFAARLEQEKQRATEAAEAARKEAAEKEAALQAQLDAIETAKNSRFHKVNRAMALGTMFVLFVICIVTAEMNRHNVKELFNQMIPAAILYIFAYVLGFMPVIFAWVKDHAKVEEMTWILPIDYIGTIVLYIILSNMSPLAENWQWLANNQVYIHLMFSLAGGIFYALQAKNAYVKLLEIISQEKYKDFFMSLFD